jgi:hypothetical protein
MTTRFRSLILAALILGVAAPAALADKASHRKAAEDLLKVMGMEKLLKDGIDQSLDIQIKANPQLEPFKDTMKDFLYKHMSWESLKDDLVTIYVDAFTEEELKEIRAFYLTPVGKKVAEKTPSLSAKGMQLGVERVQKNQPELIRMIREAAQKKAQ